jgi:hypothetical protein
MVMLVSDADQLWLAALAMVALFSNGVISLLSW